MGGARWDAWRTRCPLPTGGAASRPMCQPAWRSGCSETDRTLPSSGGSAADVTPREPQATDWRGGRAAGSTSMNPVFSGPATGLAGARGGDLAGAAPSGTTCSDLQAGQFAKRVSVMRSVTDEEARVPRARERAASFTSRHRRPDRVRVRDGSPSGGETPVSRWLDAQRDSPAPHRGDTRQRAFPSWRFNTG